MPNDLMPLRRALISVSDKSGLLELARQLSSKGVELLSTGGTAKALSDAGLVVKDVAEHTGFPEMMDGRLKTLHPKVHGGLLAVRENAEHEAAAAAHGIAPIDLLVVNLYPFEETRRKGGDYETSVENIDIGGPAMIRAAAKNHDGVTVIVDPADYGGLIAELERAGGMTSFAFRRRMAAKAFARTAEYDGRIAAWMTAVAADPSAPDERYPPVLTLQLTKAQSLRYGENPHQAGAFYKEKDAPIGSVAAARQLLGKELSYNNIADADAALECVKEFGTSTAACVVVKHANPCGVAEADDLRAAYDRAYATDPESAFGGIIAFNRPLDAATATAILERQFVEVIIAPAADEAALAVMAAKRNVRLLVTGPWQTTAAPRFDMKHVNGGLLVQDADLSLTAGWKVVSRRQPDEREAADLAFAMKVAKFVKSNAIVFARDRATVGVGAGQMSRVNSTRIAIAKAEQAGLAVAGSVVASDAFFPFADGIEELAKAGATAVVHPGGSMRDTDVIAAADQLGLAMVMTGMRHFRH
ncbi:MAG: bifunctional phosphoribosylaminoimidazolecarboxamide formyltransferase/IMP cyclohydrolase [Hyphomicrobium sp.]|nr:bifunctional phosphoribosylaminoimidazolecarboxamide formyltransferase/IMP cyclohydrolase [Hyphomicrobium sp.]